eukprot:CAMPEP_0175990752 /NCGR_PEP_ID=MMETSP0108-20121206/52471_1 /TAXON_ID=195067 ORGANISM="Goniomonas pacifica, Strain CCMP1869" /NCGR_SAMPLE_ID=MMETSP0108 /ASSEMBLY_ACC=CAM_ASM_000204 /LENGTH=36 /DNA_ID= /DNA_START= /DNA_END= /DNA_ORIENTATION=
MGAHASNEAALREPRRDLEVVKVCSGADGPGARVPL